MSLWALGGAVAALTVVYTPTFCELPGAKVWEGAGTGCAVMHSRPGPSVEVGLATLCLYRRSRRGLGGCTFAKLVILSLKATIFLCNFAGEKPIYAASHGEYQCKGACRGIARRD